MMAGSDHAREARARRAAKRDGLTLHKNRNDGLFCAADENNIIVWGHPANGLGLSLEEIETEYHLPIG